MVFGQVGSKVPVQAHIFLSMVLVFDSFSRELVREPIGELSASCDDTWGRRSSNKVWLCWQNKSGFHDVKMT